GQGGKLFDWRASRGIILLVGPRVWGPSCPRSRRRLRPSTASRPLPCALCPAPAVLRPPPAFRGVGRRAVRGPCYSTKALREKATREELQPECADNGSSNSEIISVVLKEDVITGIILGPSNSDLSLKSLDGKLCVLLMLGSKRRPSCLTQAVRTDLFWTDGALRTTVILLIESGKSNRKTRALVVERLSHDSKADVVAVYQAYITGAPKTVTVISQCLRAVPLAPATVRPWVRDDLSSIGYPVPINRYMLITSQTTAQLADGVPVECILRDRWDSPQTMLCHYDLCGSIVRVRPIWVTSSTNSSSARCAMSTPEQASSSVSA
ncbi:MAG: hypothetical protein BJ554DRAFT_716, partial [Olpidium bornovanus]